ncbi:MAG: AAA family ATPase [Marinobacter sp.]|nr:AAA family ATPase [Marinobacter sp.]
MSGAVDQTVLIKALQNPALYDHPVSEFKVLETHISWVLLTGDYAYKIKKPMDFGFLNFSTLALRQHFCNEELRLNKRSAADLYLEVLPITGSEDNPALGGDGTPIEYCLRMRQFDQTGLLDKMQERGALSAELLEALARDVALFHAQLPTVDPVKPLGTPGAVYAAMQENFDQIRPLLDDAGLLTQLDALEAWTRCTYERLHDTIAERREQGFVRECHGDLHLANITQHKGKVTLFDCIEFNEPFRWIDTINDIAFLLMDLESRGEQRLASLTLNTYLEFSGDYNGLALLPLYKAYRAVVRAKIALFTLGNPSLNASERAHLMQRYRAYADLAESYSEIPNRYLLAMMGLSGSGKSVMSKALATDLGLIRLRSDVERKRLFGLAPLDSSKSDTGTGIYTPEATAQTYQRLAVLADQLLALGYSVVVDAACLREAERAHLEAVAEIEGVPFILVECEAPEELRRQWISERQGDASEAGVDLLETQKGWLEPLTEHEKTHALRVHTEDDRVCGALAARIRAHLGL